MILAPEFSAIERLIDARIQQDALLRLQEAQQAWGRIPETRYLHRLYEATFRIRSDMELLQDVRELVLECPELIEASVLLAELYARTGDPSRAQVFIHRAISSGNRAASERCAQVQKRSSLPAYAVSTGDADARVTDEEKRELGSWFYKARHDMIRRRTPAYGVRDTQSVVEVLLLAGEQVARGSTQWHDEALALRPSSLALLDVQVFERSRTLRQRLTTSQREQVAGFFLALALRELGGIAQETSPEDGGCKLLLPSGAGVRPLSILHHFMEGNGPSLSQSYERLRTAGRLTSTPPHRSRSSGKIPAVAPLPFAPVQAETIEQLALTRPQVEVCTLLAVQGRVSPGSPPSVSPTRIAQQFLESVEAQTIQLATRVRLGADTLSVAALETFARLTPASPGAADAADAEERSFSWGALLGESIIASYGGLWGCDPNAPGDPFLFRVVSNEHIFAWPMAQVALRFRRGATADLSHYLDEVGTLLDASLALRRK